jgi:nicotinamide-nucleotide amidase
VTRPHEAKARMALAALKKAGLRVALAESCTGGLVSAALTDVPGSSAVVERGFVVYSNEAKTELLGVPADLVARCGAVSEPVAVAMAEGALAASPAEVAVAVTGVAGPGGTAAKPEGLVHFACALRGGETVARRREFGAVGRARVRDESVDQALDLLIEAAERVGAA